MTGSQCESANRRMDLERDLFTDFYRRSGADNHRVWRSAPGSWASLYTTHMVEPLSFTDYVASIYSSVRNVSTGQDTDFHKKSDVGSHCVMDFVTFIGKWSRSEGNSIW